MQQENQPFIINNNPNAEGCWNDINHQQIEILNSFKEKLQNELIIPDTNKYSDLFYLRFLRARKFNLNKSFSMIQKYFQWRQKENVDSIMSFQFFWSYSSIWLWFSHRYHTHFLC